MMLYSSPVLRTSMATVREPGDYMSVLVKQVFLQQLRLGQGQEPPVKWDAPGCCRTSRFGATPGSTESAIAPVALPRAVSRRPLASAPRRLAVGIATEAITAGEISENGEKRERGPPNTSTAIPTKSPAEELMENITIETQSSAGFDSKAGVATNKALLRTESDLKKSRNVKNLIHKFSGGESPQSSPSGSPTTTESSPGKISTGKLCAEKHTSETALTETKKTENGSASGQNQVDVTKSDKNGESDFDPNKQPESPPSEEEPSHPKVSQNPKYQLFLGSDVLGNSSRDPDGTTRENGPRNSRWESNSSRSGPNNYRGSLESLASRDWDTMSDKAAANMLSMRPAAPSKRDFIEELTAQLDAVQKRNQFLEAESIELDKERNQIRFEMRGLLVQIGDLQRINTQLQVEMKKTRERITELETDNGMMNERFGKQESELKEAREMMVEAHTQEYAFNFLQQSLKNKIKDHEEALEKQTQQMQALSEKLWHAERELEELKAEKQLREKKTGDLNSTVMRLEAELGEALKAASQADAERRLYQKLKDDAQARVEELEESLLERAQELQKTQQTVIRLQGEVGDVQRHGPLLHIAVPLLPNPSPLCIFFSWP
ncbi:hypothetical protein Z043_104244 [Scleropages formosus]|uniref:Uncharacterized protein n=1 Tax=Scleropages formosus TaxID=113540 RepID=A0A0P7UPJ9_SCLFO|nr:hypothetical protein Z043_104244 [Scleropages formosus]